MSKEIKVSGYTRNLDHVAEMMRRLGDDDIIRRHHAAMEVAIWAKDVLGFEEEMPFGGTMHGRVCDFKSGLCESLDAEMREEVARNGLKNMTPVVIPLEAADA